MALKTFNPTTPSQRQLVIVDRSELWKGKPLKALTEGLRGKGGRNNTGRTTMRWRGGGHKRRYRIVDFKRAKTDMPATVERHPEHDLVVLGDVGRLLGDDRSADDVVHLLPRQLWLEPRDVPEPAHLRRASRCSTAARVNTSLSRRRMS